MIASIVVIVFCAALLVYWLRATAILLIRQSPIIARESHLQVVFTELRQQALAGAALGTLHDALQRDARVLTYLLKHASEIAPGDWEDTVILWDYRLMRFWFSVSRVAFPTQARKALADMARALSVLEGRLRTRTAAL